MNDLEPMQDEHRTADFEPSTNVLTLLGHFDPEQQHTILRLENGQTIQLETSLLLRARLEATVPDLPAVDRTNGQTVVFPVVQEHLEVGKRTVTTGAVRIHKRVQPHTETLDEVLAIRTFEVERVPLNRLIESAPPVRQEGSVTIYSVVEEQLVLTKQLVLKEEVRVIQRDTERKDTQVVTLHKEHVTIERESLT